MKAKNQNNVITRESIVTALLELIYEKPFSSITISELTERAGVSRMAFYRNYNSKEEIFKSELVTILEEYRLKSLKSNGSNYYDIEHLKTCFSYFYKYNDLIRGMVHCGFGHVFYENLEDFILKKWGKENDEDLTYKLVAFSGILYSVYIKWMNDGCKKTSKEVANLVNSFCYGFSDYKD